MNLNWEHMWVASSEFVSSSIPSRQILTAHAQPFKGARDLAFCLKVPLDSLLVWASSEGSGETARMRSLAWTFAACIGDKYQIRLTRSMWFCWFCWSTESWAYICSLFTPWYRGSLIICPVLIYLCAALECMCRPSRNWCCHWRLISWLRPRPRALWVFRTAMLTRRFRFTRGRGTSFGWYGLFRIYGNQLTLFHNSSLILRFLLGFID